LNALRLGDIEDDFIPEEMGETAQDATTTTSSKILSTTERTGAQRLSLFSKRALSETASSETPLCFLQPKELKLPMEPPGPSPLNLGMVSTTATLPPLHQALTAYERQFMLYLAQGRVLADGADLRLAACQTCVQEQAVIARALRAAVSNLADHYHTATHMCAEFTTSFQSKLAAHSNLLQRFEQNLSHLASVNLHSSLVSMAHSSGRVLETSLDTVPVEKERAWAQQCELGHARLTALYAELDTAFRDLGTVAIREEEATRDWEAEEEVQKLWNEVEGQMRQYRDAQAQRLDHLMADHSDVVKIIMHALDSENRGDEDTTQAAFAPLGEKSKYSKAVVPAMIEDNSKIKETTERVEQAKTRSMQRMKVRLKEISRAQSNIQRVLTNVGVVRDAMTQQMDNMAHLEHLSELPESYRAFLSEIRRRLAYGQANDSLSRSMVERLATFRSDELKAREKFLRRPGCHLMPVFFDLFVPTLATPLPLFTPQMPAMVELDTLPHVGEESTVGAGTMEMYDPGALAGTEMHAAGGVGSESSLTAESHPNSSGQQQHTSAATDPMLASAVRSATAPAQHRPHGDDKGEQEKLQEAAQQQQQQQQEQLIVSADEHSENDLIVDRGEGAAAEAEVKTLAYENSVLRQTIERLGGKPPRAYLEEAAAERNKHGNVANSNTDNTAIEMAYLKG